MTEQASLITTNLTLLLAIAAVLQGSTAAWLLSLSIRQASMRHLLLFCGLLWCAAVPGLLTIGAIADVLVGAIPVHWFADNDNDLLAERTTSIRN
jgi:hypothetical protein